MLKINRKTLEDKIHACWIGKNIGGTIGTPYEGKTEMLDINGFASKKGEPLPNDDLDLQLVWLYALEQYGPYQMNASVLGEYWLSLIGPGWNEYGICKANMRLGYAPPISGELHNEKWKTSNGAWIRSEVWACLAPGYPGIARKYAFYDASVDHGISEGTVAELFTVTLESEAFVNNNIRSVIEHALDNIPADSRVAAAVRLVIECYDKGIPYRETREKVVQQSADIGFFQAPANVAFVVIGLLYGEGDFKKSMIYAVNCGDDTDCTGATLGSVLGIMNGVAGIPADWREYIGDEIKPICINGEKVRKMPATCAELTERILKMLPVLLYANGVAVTFTDGENEWDDNRYKFGVSGRQLLNRAPYSLDLPHSPYLSGRVDFDREPLLGAGESLDLHFRLHIASCLSAWCEVNVFTPDGITAQYDKTVSVHYTCKSGTELTVRLTAEKPLAARNDVYVALRCDAHIMPVIVPVTIGGK